MSRTSNRWPLTSYITSTQQPRQKSCVNMRDATNAFPACLRTYNFSICRCNRLISNLYAQKPSGNIFNKKQMLGYPFKININKKQNPSTPLAIPYSHPSSTTSPPLRFAFWEKHTPRCSNIYIYYSTHTYTMYNVDRWRLPRK